MTIKTDVTIRTATVSSYKNADFSHVGVGKIDETKPAHYLLHLGGKAGNEGH